MLLDTLYYFKSSTVMDPNVKPSGAIEMKDCHSVELQCINHNSNDKDNDNCDEELHGFAINTGARLYHFATTTRIEAWAWVNSLNSSISTVKEYKSEDNHLQNVDLLIQYHASVNKSEFNKYLHEKIGKIR